VAWLRRSCRSADLPVPPRLDLDELEKKAGDRLSEAQQLKAETAAKEPAVEKTHAETRHFRHRNQYADAVRRTFAEGR
jgi:hypothetical protein